MSGSRLGWAQSGCVACGDRGRRPPYASEIPRAFGPLPCWYTACGLRSTSQAPRLCLSDIHARGGRSTDAASGRMSQQVNPCAVPRIPQPFGGTGSDADRRGISVVQTGRSRLYQRRPHCPSAANQHGGRAMQLKTRAALAAGQPGQRSLPGRTRCPADRTAWYLSARGWPGKTGRNWSRRPGSWPGLRGVRPRRRTRAALSCRIPASEW